MKLKAESIIQFCPKYGKPLPRQLVRLIVRSSGQRTATSACKRHGRDWQESTKKISVIFAWIERTIRLLRNGSTMAYYRLPLTRIWKFADAAEAHSDCQNQALACRRRGCLPLLDSGV